jgi:hypothetical protein
VEEVVREGSNEEYNECLGYLRASAEEKKAKAQKNIHLEYMLRHLNGYNVIQFLEGAGGYYSYKPTKGGEGDPRIYVSPKVKM